MKTKLWMSLLGLILLALLTTQCAPMPQPSVVEKEVIKEVVVTATPGGEAEAEGRCRWRTHSP